MIKYYVVKNTKFLDKIEVFSQEFDKFNDILEKKLDGGLSYKFAITTEEEVQKNELPQLGLASDKDIIVSNGAYLTLKNEFSLVRVSANSYKRIFLEQAPDQVL